MQLFFSLARYACAKPPACRPMAVAERIRISLRWLTLALLIATPSPGATLDNIHPGRRLSDAGQEAFDIVTQGVDTRTRNYVYSHTDIALPGAIGPRVALTRTFSANDTGEGPFGAGWSWRFFSDHTPIPAAHSGDVATTEGETYTYAAAEDANSEPRLTRVTDRHGSQISFRYADTAPGGHPLLTAIETFHTDKGHGYALVQDYSLAIRWSDGDSGRPRCLSVTSYQENPKRTKLQTVTYAYMNGHAHSVTSERSPGGKITRYAYHRWAYAKDANTPPVYEDDLLSAITDADGAATRIAYNDEWDSDYETLTQPDAPRVQAARITDPSGRVTEFVPTGTDGGASGTHLMTRHTELMPGGADGYSVRSVYYVPDASGTWVVSGWHSLGVERRYDTAGRLIEEDSRAGFRWSRRVPARLLAPPRSDMDYDDRRHFWTLVDMMHAVFWQDVFSPGVPGAQLLDGGIVYRRKLYTYDDAEHGMATTVQGFPFTPDESLPDASGPLTYTRSIVYWGPEKYGQKKLEIDPSGRRVFYDYYSSHAAPELRGNLRAVYADVSAGVRSGRPIAYNPFDRPITTAGSAALGARPRPDAIPIRQIEQYDPLGQPQTIRTLESLSPPRFSVERRAPGVAPLGLPADRTITMKNSVHRTTTLYDPLGRTTQQSVTQNGKLTSQTQTAYAHTAGDLMASDGEIAHTQRQIAAITSTQDFRYTPSGRLLTISTRAGDGPQIRRTAQYETHDGALTGRPIALDETWDGAARFHLAYTYGGFGGEDLIRKTLTVAGGAPETWSWEYGRTFTAAGLDMPRIPSRIVQTAPPSAHLPLQAIDYLYDSCLGALGLVRFHVVDSNPAELATEWLQEQHPSQFEFVWYAHDSFGRTYDIRSYHAQYGQAPRPNAYTYTLTSRTERFRLKPDPNNLSGYDPMSFNAATAPFDPAGNIPYQRTTQYAPDGKTPRATQQELRTYDLSDRLATSKSDNTVGEWTRATHTDFENYDGLTQPLWTPDNSFLPEIPISRRVRRAGGGYTDIFYDDGQPLMEREYDKSGKLSRVRTRMVGARGTEAVTKSDGHGNSQITWTVK